MEKDEDGNRKGQTLYYEMDRILYTLTMGCAIGEDAASPCGVTPFPSLTCVRLFLLSKRGLFQDNVFYLSTPAKRIFDSFLLWGFQEGAGPVAAYRHF